MNTGRVSSGEQNKSTGEKYPNFQNIPGDPETRACFIAEEGNSLIICDYSGQEQIVLANVSLDPGLLAFYDSGGGDMHSFIVKKWYPELEPLTVDEIKKFHKDKRQWAKIAGFAINYGGVGQTIADQLNISKAEGDKIYDSYFEVFPGLKKYLKDIPKQALRDGYILISPLTERKSYLPNFETYKELERNTAGDFWDRYREAKAENSPSFRELKKTSSDFFYHKGIIERAAQNYPIQGRSGEITKISCVHIFDYIIDNNLFDIVKFVNTVHDENVVEAPDDILYEIGEMVKDSMFKAGERYCKRVPLLAEPDYSKFWRKG